MNDTELLRNKLIDTANRAYHQNSYTFTHFLGISELSIYNSIKKELSFIKSITFGGNDSCERQLVRFGDPDELGYEEIFPISLLHISPMSVKFAEQLGHRDYLGALMNLNIQRDLIGDIIIKDKEAYIFCMDHIAEYICTNLDSIRHTHVKCKICDNNIDIIKSELKSIEVIAASDRADAIVSGITKLSRNSCTELFSSKKIFINGLCTENKSARLKEGDILVIRGYGKYIFNGCGNETKKGRVYVHLKQYT